ncbi:hypothetical protein Q4493_15970 [Colwellia sp. 1_MG-2023]|uniref:hypothetical protein n=1 Tax=Colwellia sp. 1_MG-2023 TaxID=3062649 RepID=UPI0026E39FCD|nr:hypothetical protein [Colwellia sp. 1_MG-2023]MDO6447267.1 hypothetical protein [Colwellia sp. 1_MG-2023]
MRIYHWFYVSLLLAVTLGRLIQKVTMDTGGFASRYLPIIIAMLLITAYVGCVLNKPILNRYFWRGVFYFFSIVSLGALSFSFYLIISFGNTVIIKVAFIMLGLVIVFPALLSMNKYSHLSNTVWRK